MISNTLKTIFGTRNGRELKRMGKVVKQINALTDATKALSDEQLAAKTDEFKQRLADGEQLDKILPEAFAVVREAGERVLGTGFVRDARYHFSSVNPTVVNNKPPHGENWLNEFDYLTGGVGNKLIFDLNSDSLLTDADRIRFCISALTGHLCP